MATNNSGQHGGRLKPAQRQIVHERINWERLRERLARYPAIEQTFPLRTLQEACEKPPYYCHYMSWRLGAWEDECNFKRLEELLGCAKELSNWEDERRSLIGSADFAEFWSLVWQLQVAEHLHKIGTEVSWDESGPDLSVKVGDERWYVECTTPRKSFGLLKFLRDVLSKLDPDLRISYDLCLPFKLPQDSNRDPFLDKILRPFLDPLYLAKFKEAAKQGSSVTVYEDEDQSSLRVYLADGPDVVSKTVDPKSSVECALREAVDNKEYLNNLMNCRPNLLAVNYLLFDEFALADLLPKRMESLTPPRLGPNIDALAISAVGIDERLSRERLRILNRSESVEHSSLDQIAS